MIVHTKPHNNPTQHNPNTIKGTRVLIEANYFELQSQIAHTQWIIYKYHITFEPECLLKRLQMFLVAKHKSTIGGFLFDGAQLFATRKLHTNECNFIQLRSNTRDTVYTIKFTFTRIVSMSDQESLQVLNLIQRRNMSGLRLQLVGRNYYDPQNMVISLVLKMQMIYFSKLYYVNLFRSISTSSTFSYGLAMKPQYVITTMEFCSIAM